MATDFDFSGLKTTTLQDASGQPLLAIERQECSASIALKGGQILTYAPHGHHPVLWDNARIDMLSGEPLRQGIPVCWPWFGDLYANPVQIQNRFLQPLGDEAANPPNHGLVRTKEWELLNVQERSQATDVLLMTRLQHPALRLLAKYSFGDELKISLTTENLSDAVVHFSCALHSYFAVSDVSSIAIPDLDGTPYLDALRRWEKHVQNGTLVVNGEIDRAYYNTPAVIRIRDSKWQRSIIIDSEDSHSAVIWNPWIEKSRRLTQFSPEAYKSMVCIETAKVLRDAVHLEVGASYRLRVKISTLNH